MHAYPSQIKTIDSQFLCTAYCNGYFPMADPKTGEISWYSPDQRTIFDLNEFHIPRSLKLTLKNKNYEVCINKCFEEVIRACAEREETWISETIIQSYIQLHLLGLAHSVETWKSGILIGGLYGVAIRGAFFGESMFSRLRDGSKIALVNLVMRMKKRGFKLLDTQYLTPHLEKFGAREIPRSEYMKRLEESLNVTCSFIEEEL
jgi:leucyl/phenylalanyl-tRNA---protein transferase